VWHYEVRHGISACNPCPPNYELLEPTYTQEHCTNPHIITNLHPESLRHSQVKMGTPKLQRF